ncbi:MAG: hypothetical protein ACR2H5_07410 [Ktedonobacteraceae bacterium]
MAKPVKVFLLGRPGSGKTTAFHYIEMLVSDKRWKAIRFREYPILHSMFQNDIGMKVRPTEHGGFDILDFSVFFESAKCIEQQIQEYISTEPSQDFIFIELARDDYSHALTCFSPGFLQDSYFLFFEVDINTCIERIRVRVANQTSDGHFISERILRSYYFKDNKPYMTSNFKTDYNMHKRVEVIDNTASLPELGEKLEAVVSVILAKEMSDNTHTIPVGAMQ